MPAFTFEKISPPVRSGPAPPVAEKRRGVIVQIFGRLVKARRKRTPKEEKAVVARHEEQ